MHSTPENKHMIRPNETSDQKYNHWRDRSFRSIAFDVGAFFIMVYVSGKLTKNLIDRYVFEGAAEDLSNAATKIDLLKGENISSATGKISIF